MEVFLIGTGLVMFKLENHSFQMMCTVVGIKIFCNTNLQSMFHEY